MSLISAEQPELYPRPKQQRLRYILANNLFAIECLIVWLVIAATVAIVIPLFLTLVLNFHLSASQELFVILAAFTCVILLGLNLTFSYANWYEASALSRTKVFWSFLAACLCGLFAQALSISDPRTISQFVQFGVLVILTILFFVGWLMVAFDKIG